MNPEKVFEIAKKVYDKFPVTGREKSCAQEKCKREYLRAEEVKKIVEEENEKVEVSLPWAEYRVVVNGKLNQLT